ncbi:unnamed protein product, partial [Litomosoides sigmodontis]
MRYLLTNVNKEEYWRRIEGLKKLLQGEGGNRYSNDVQLVQYFALPYVIEPEKHPVFRELFQSAYRLQCNELLEKRCRKLQYDYYRIVDIVNEMFDYVEQSSQAVGVIHLSSDYITEMKARFVHATADAEEHMEGNFAIVTATTDKRLDERSRKSSTGGVKKNKMMKNDESVRNLAATTTTTIRSQSLLLKKEVKEEEEMMRNDVTGRLNYTKIGNCLIKCASGRLSCLLLQALRQRLTRVPVENARRVLATYATNDLLLLKHFKS